MSASRARRRSHKCSLRRSWIRPWAAVTVIVARRHQPPPDRSSAGVCIGNGTVRTCDLRSSSRGSAFQYFAQLLWTAIRRGQTDLIQSLMCSPLVSRIRWCCSQVCSQSARGSEGHPHCSSDGEQQSLGRSRMKQVLQDLQNSLVVGGAVWSCAPDRGPRTLSGGLGEG